VTPTRTSLIDDVISVTHYYDSQLDDVMFWMWRKEFLSRTNPLTVRFNKKPQKIKKKIEKSCRLVRMKKRIIFASFINSFFFYFSTWIDTLSPPDCGIHFRFSFPVIATSACSILLRLLPPFTFCFQMRKFSKIK